MKRFRRTGAALAGVTIALAAPAAAIAAQCRDHAGEFTAVAPETCASPVGICTHGTLTGEFPSTYDFVAQTMTFTGPNTAQYTGNSTITTENGARIYGDDSGTMTFDFATMTATFETTVAISGGTRQYSHAVSGQFVAPGTLSLLTGSTTGTYTATICKGNGTDAGTQ